MLGRLIWPAEISLMDEEEKKSANDLHFPRAVGGARLRERTLRKLSGSRELDIQNIT